MPIAIVVALLAQVPDLDPMLYVRAHRDADNALVAGKVAEARAGFASCLEMSPRNATVAYALACTEARAGEKPKSLDWFERAAEWNYADADVAAWDLDLVGLRSEKGFSAALERMRARRPVSSAPLDLSRVWRGRGHSPYGYDVAIQPGGQYVVVSQKTGCLQLLDSKSGQALRSSPQLGGTIVAAEFEPTGKQVIALTLAGNLHFWSTSGEQASRTVKSSGPTGESEIGPDFERRFVQFNLSGDRMLVVDGRSRGSALRDSKGELISAWDVSFGSGHQALIAWSPDGSRLALAAAATVKFVDGRTGENAAESLETPSSIVSIAYQPGGSLLATGHQDGRLRVWDLRTGEMSFEHAFMWGDKASELSVDATEFSPDGRWLAAGTGDGGCVEILAVSTHSVLKRFECKKERFGSIPRGLRWGADSRRLWFAFCSEGNDVDSITLDDEQPSSLVYSGSSPRIGKTGLAVAIGADGAVFALDAKTGRCLWHRTMLDSGAEVLQSATGYFTTDLETLDELNTQSQYTDPGNRSLTGFVTSRFDPKRVRAARDGVLIIPVSF